MPMSVTDWLLTDPALRTFYELDQQYAKPKGTAFRAFKVLGERLLEGQHFFCCDGRLEPARFAELSASERLYRGTLNAVFVNTAGCALIGAILQGDEAG